MEVKESKVRSKNQVVYVKGGRHTEEDGLGEEGDCWQEKKHYSG